MKRYVARPVAPFERTEAALPRRREFSTRLSILSAP
jgi:hypothetical protein